MTKTFAPSLSKSDFCNRLLKQNRLGHYHFRLPSKQQLKDSGICNQRIGISWMGICLVGIFYLNERKSTTYKISPESFERERKLSIRQLNVN